MGNKEFLDDDIFKFDEDEEDLVTQKNVKTSKPIQTPPQEKVIQSKPTLEVKEIAQNPYKERYTSKKQTPQKTQRKKPLKQDVAVKKLVSISQKNLEVVKILREISKFYPSESEFICQAIIEKYHRETEIKETDIKTLVKNALEELVGEKYIIMKGSSDVSIVNTQSYIPQQGSAIINQSSVNEAISKQEENENKSLLAGMLDDMDDDDI